MGNSLSSSPPKREEEKRGLARGVPHIVCVTPPIVVERAPLMRGRLYSGGLLFRSWFTRQWVGDSTCMTCLLSGWILISSRAPDRHQFQYWSIVSWWTRYDHQVLVEPHDGML
eukprot:sb/3476982/